MRRLVEYVEIYDFKSLCLMSVASAIDLSERTQIALENAFLVRNLRKPDDLERKLLSIKTRTQFGLRRIIEVNLTTYIAQNLKLQCSWQLPSTPTIIDEYTKVAKCKPTDIDVNSVANYCRFGDYGDLNRLYPPINTWQPMAVSKVIWSNNIQNTEVNIRTIFNKIYNRIPSSDEVGIISGLKPTQNIEEVRNAFQRFVRVSDESCFRGPKRLRLGSRKDRRDLG